MTAALNDRRNAVVGIATIVATVFAMALADAIVKDVSSGFPLWQIYVVRSLVVVPVLVAMLAAGRQPARLRPLRLGWTAARSMLLALMYIAIYAALPVLSLSVVAAALYTGPLFIALFSAVLIGEPVGPKRWIGVVLGFAGVLVILRPATDAFSFAMLIPVIAALLYALAAIITRTKCAAESPMVLALALNYALLAVGVAATGAIALWRPASAAATAYPFLLGAWVAMGPSEWGVVAVLAALMVAIGCGLAKAYQSGPPALIATFDYSYLAFAAFWSFVFFAEVPDTATVAGMVLIAVAGLLAIAGRRQTPGRGPAITRGP